MLGNFPGRFNWANPIEFVVAFLQKIYALRAINETLHAMTRVPIRHVKVASFLKRWEGVHVTYSPEDIVNA